MFDVIIPKMGQATVEVDLVEWRVKNGDSVMKGDVMAVVESEKTSVEIEAPVDGTVGEILFQEGDEVQVGMTICRIQEA